MYNTGFFAAATLQNELFGQLREVGVLGMITDVTTRKFFRPAVPLTKEELKSTPTIIKDWPNDEGFWREAFDHSGWRVSVLGPEMSAVGKWNERLRIEATRSHSDFYGGGLHLSQKDRVLFSYLPRQLLFINGARRVFNGQLVIPPPTPQTEQLEAAVAQAFHQPKIERFYPKPRPLIPPIRLTARA